jgi:hypothetical protein
VVEAIIPHGMVPTSTSNIPKVIDILHMLWMGKLSPQHAVTPTLVGLDLESQQRKSLITAGCWVSNDTIKDWLILSSHMEWFPHPFNACKRRLTNFICCGWGYGASIMLLPPHLWDRDWKVS